MVMYVCCMVCGIVSVVVCEDDMPGGVYWAPSQRAWIVKRKPEGSTKAMMVPFRVRQEHTKDNTWHKHTELVLPTRTGRDCDGASFKL